MVNFYSESVHFYTGNDAPVTRENKFCTPIKLFGCTDQMV